MKYMFHVLVLGDASSAITFLLKGGAENTDENGEFSVWHTSLNYAGNGVEMDISVAVTSGADYDSIIPVVDGIIYFVDPSDGPEMETFGMIADILMGIRREIPFITVFYSRNGYVKEPSNKLLYTIWDNYPFEAFVFSPYSEGGLSEVLECLAEAMISGTRPINPYTAWMRVPFLINKINKSVVNERYYEAAKLCEILTRIRRNMGAADWYINAEQTAWLYYKEGKFREAAAILEEVDAEEAAVFKKYYVKSLIGEGMRLYRTGRFIRAAETLEKAALWAAIEIDDTDLYRRALDEAINAWIESGEFRNAFVLIEKLDHMDQLELMNVIIERILSSADRLIKAGKFDTVKAQLYFAIDKYQRKGLFDCVKKLALKISELLEILLRKYIDNKSPDDALITLDELENIRDTFGLEHTDLNPYLSDMAELFISSGDFAGTDRIIDKITDPELKALVTEKRNEAEEMAKKHEQIRKAEELENAMKLLAEYIRVELDIFTEMTENIIAEAEEITRSDKYSNAVARLREMSNWFARIGAREHADVLYEKMADIMLEGGMINNWLSAVKSYSGENREHYIASRLDKVIKSVEMLIRRNEIYDKIIIIIENLIKLYRNHLLYDYSKKIAEFEAKYILSAIRKILKEKAGVEIIPKILDMLRKVKLIYGEIGGRDDENTDDIYAEIAERYLAAGNSAAASKYTDMIKNPEIYSELHTKILNFEERRSKARAEGFLKIMDTRMKAESLSMLARAARDIAIIKDSIIKTRNALRRTVYKKYLEALTSGDPEKALEESIKITVSMAAKRKLETAGIGLVMTALILIGLGRNGEISRVIEEIADKLGGSYRIFSETFASKLVDFLHTMSETGNKEALLGGLELVRHLGLFPEEEKWLDIFKEIIEGKKTPDILRSNKIIAESSEVKAVPVEEAERISAEHSEYGNTVDRTQPSDKEIFDTPTVKRTIRMLGKKLADRYSGFIKRKMMRRKYWDRGLTLISERKYGDAADEYFMQIDHLMENNHNDYVPIAFVMGIMCLLKEGRTEIAERYYGKILDKIGGLGFILGKYPEVTIMKYILEASRSGRTDIISTAAEVLSVNLPLFEEEKGLLSTFIEHKGETGAEIGPTQQGRRKGVASDRSSEILLEQHLTKLAGDIADIRSEVGEMKSKRSRMRRIFYKDILSALSTGDLIKAAEEYKKAAVRMASRNDYFTSGLLILLGGLAILSGGGNISDVQNYYRKFMEDIGFTGKVVAETPGAKLLGLIIDAEKSGLKSISARTKLLIEELPLLDEEKSLITHLKD